jgi:hypothetical protein
MRLSFISPLRLSAGGRWLLFTDKSLATALSDSEAEARPGGIAICGALFTSQPRIYAKVLSSASEVQMASTSHHDRFFQGGKNDP